MKTYKVVAERSGKWWAFSIPEILGGHGQARRLEQVRIEATDVIALMEGIEAETIEVELVTKLDPATEKLVAAAKEARTLSEKAQQEVIEATRRAAEQLKDIAFLSLRDIGKLLDVSFQRVSQVLNDKTKTNF